MSAAAPAPRRPTVVQRVAAELIRYVAFTQSMGLVGLHVAWMLLLVIAVDGGAHGDAPQALGRMFKTAMRWLGGIDADGRGDLDTVFAMWAKASLLLFVPKMLLDRLRGPRQPWPLLRALGASTLLLALGFAGAFVLLYDRTVDATPGGFALVWLALVVSGIAAGAWAFGAARFGDMLAEHVLVPPRTAAPAAAHPRR